MSTCIICLGDCDNSICSACSCCCHFQCWNKYLKKNHNNVLEQRGDIWITTCPHCKAVGTCTVRLTRNVVKHNLQKDKYVVQIRRMLDAFKSVKDTNERAVAATKVFKVVVESRRFIFDEHDAFKNTVRKKLIELHNSNKRWRGEARKYWKILFGGKME